MAAYRVDVRKSQEGYSVSCPDLPGCWSQGATEAEALAKIQIAIQEYVDAAEEIGRKESREPRGGSNSMSMTSILRIPFFPIRENRNRNMQEICGIDYRLAVAALEDAGFWVLR